MTPFDQPLNSPTPTISFVLLPVGWFASGDEAFQTWQLALLQRAYDDARAAARACWLESDPLGRWN
jgi:hypothetical protein